MSLAKITQVTGTAATFRGDDVDTDRIIPARFMKCVTFDGLGEYLFYDVRFEPATGKPTGHMLDKPERKGATILVAENNFGCGSSREHAPQALQKFGIKAVIAGGYAEIFFGNSTTLGMPCVTLAPNDLARLTNAVEKDAALKVAVDLAAKKVSWGGDSAPLTMKEGARQALVEGQWDAIGQLLEGADLVAKLEAATPYLR